MEKLKGLLIEDWKRAWKFLSMWCAGLLIFIDTAHDSLPIVKEYLPDDWVKWIAATIIITRLINQNRKKA